MQKWSVLSVRRPELKEIWEDTCDCRTRRARTRPCCLYSGERAKVEVSSLSNRFVSRKEVWKLM